MTPLAVHRELIPFLRFSPDRRNAPIGRRWRSEKRKVFWDGGGGSCCAGSKPSSVKEFAVGLGDDDLAEQLVSLQEVVVSGSTDWSGTELYSAVDRARRKLQTNEVSSE